jgi:hypothetical protein
MTEWTLRVPEHVHWRRFDSEIVVVDLKQGQYLGLNDVAADAFERLATGRSTGDVVGELLGVYDVESAELEADIAQLVGSLVERGLLVREGMREGTGAK